MGDIVADIINNIKKNNLYDKYSKIIDDLEEYDYDKDWIDAPAACGDMYLYTFTYKIGEYSFEYSHTLGDSDIGSSKFTISYGDKTDIIFLSSFFSQKLVEDTDNSLLNKFKNTYPLELDEDYSTLFNILNGFASNRCIGFITDNNETFIGECYVDEIIDIYSPENSICDSSSEGSENNDSESTAS